MQMGRPKAATHHKNKGHDMTDTNQKLREALQAISHIDDTTNHSVDASAALDRIGQIARQALALPTADHLPDAGKMVVDHFPDATKMIETAAPVGEREAFEELIEEFEAAAIDKHDCRNPEYQFEHRAYDAACQRYDAIIAALRAKGQS
jgi:hypothetical protein